MTTSSNIDGVQRLGRRFRWLAALGVVVVAAVVAVTLRSADGADQPEEELELPEQLAARVAETMEQRAPTEDHDHDHGLHEGVEGWVCAAETFGFTPADATSAEQVDEVYAHYLCAEYGTGFPWPDAIRASGPVAVEFTDPPAVRLPEDALPGEDGVDHADRIRAIIPEEHHPEALRYDGFVPAEVRDTLERRFEATAQ